MRDFVELFAGCVRPCNERRLWDSGILLRLPSSSIRWGMEVCVRSARGGLADFNFNSEGLSAEFLRKKDVTRCGILPCF